MSVIFESYLLTATNTDVLSGGRLNAIPYNGQLTLQFQADLAVAANHWDLVLQRPGGDVPVDGMMIPAQAGGVAGVMHEDTLLQFTFPASQGGHFVVSCTETGTAILLVHAILRF